MATITRLAGMRDVPNPSASSTAVDNSDAEAQLQVVPPRPSRAALPINRRRSAQSLQSANSRNSLSAVRDTRAPPPPPKPHNDSTSTAVESHTALDQKHQQQQHLHNDTYTATRDDTSPLPQDSSDEIPWGPRHPCYPHPNPHVSKSSPEYTSTRVIRVARDYLVAGDLYPQFQNVYPEILSELISEDEFRVVLDEVNGRLKAGFEPSGARAVVDALMGTFTGFFWDDLGATKTKAAVKGVEMWMEDWNRKRIGEGRRVKLIPLRRTGYMNLDIQVPDPELDIEGTEETKRH